MSCNYSVFVASRAAGPGSLPATGSDTGFSAVTPDSLTDARARLSCLRALDFVSTEVHMAKVGNEACCSRINFICRIVILTPSTTRRMQRSPSVLPLRRTHILVTVLMSVLKTTAPLRTPAPARGAARRGGAYHKTACVVHLARLCVPVVRGRRRGGAIRS